MRIEQVYFTDARSGGAHAHDGHALVPSREREDVGGHGGDHDPLLEESTRRTGDRKVPLMGVLGAFIFVSQMIVSLSLEYLHGEFDGDFGMDEVGAPLDSRDLFTTRLAVEFWTVVPGGSGREQGQRVEQED